MITTLHISNYALIEQLDIELYNGFNIITGETGAGKSIILGALGLLLGGRADLKAVRNPQHKSVIEAVFTIDGYDSLHRLLAENDIDNAEESLCILRRELTPSGRSRAFINDTPVNLNLLREAAIQLVDIHSQHQNLLIADRSYQLSIIDAMAGNGALLASYRKAYEAYRLALKAYSDTRDAATANRDAIDLWQFQSAQLTDARLTEGEQQQLEDERETLTNVSEIKEHLSEALNCLSYAPENAAGLLADAVAACRAAAAWLPDGIELTERIDSARIEIQDIAATLDSHNNNLQADPDRLINVEERLNRLYSLQATYHCDSVAGLIKLRDEITARLAAIDNSDELLDQLKAKAVMAKKEAMELARRLSESRQQHARLFADELKHRAMPMGMTNLQCHIALTTGRLTPSGIDSVDFLFAFNKNQQLRPVEGTASGGEISRLMLAIKSIIAERMCLPTIIFDEIDTGVSGEIATRMADIMYDISRHIQVITITHLPAVAARGDAHFKVYKQDDEHSTTTRIELLDRQRRAAEIATMISGHADEASLAAARQLLDV